MNSSHNSTDTHTTQQPLEEGEMDQNQNVILKSLPPGKEIVSLFLQCCRCSDMAYFLTCRLSFHCIDSHTVCRECLPHLSDGACPFVSPDGDICKNYLLRFQDGELDYFYYSRQMSQSYCPFWDYGCTRRAIGRSLEFHREECAFRPLSSCIFTDCPKKRMVMSDFINHIESDHYVGVELATCFRKQISFSQNEILDSGEHRLVLTLLECYDSQFVVVMQETKEKYFLWVVQSPSKNAERKLHFRCRAELHDRFQFCSKRVRDLVGVWETKGLQRFWDFPIHSIHRPIEEIIHGGECFEICKQTLSTNACYYLGTRKDGSQFWSIELNLWDLIVENENELPNMYDLKWCD